MNRVFRYVFCIFFGLYFLLGFIAGNALAAVMTHTLIKGISAPVADGIAALCIVALAAAIPLPKVAIRVFARSARFSGNSLMFWQVLMVVSAVFGAIFGSLLPNGPFNAM